MNPLSLPSLSLALSLATTLAAGAADWPEWRGPKRDDHSPDQGLLQAWPAGGPKQLWLSDQGGLGYAGFAIVGGKLFTLGSRAEQEYLLALDAATGKELWATAVGSVFVERRGDGPRVTPTVHGNRVYAMGARGTLACVEADTGKKVWQKSLTEDLGGKLQAWGYSESVLVVGNLVICTPGGEQGTLAALNKDTGAVVWQTKDLTDFAQYSSPILATVGGKPQVIQLVMKQVFGVAPDTGKVLWSHPFKQGSVAVIPTPIYRDGHVFISAGYKAGCMLVKLGADGTTSTVYEQKAIDNHHGGVILVGDYLYGHADSRGWMCQEFLTGKEMWASKDLGKGAVHYADGMLYCVSEDKGVVALVEASPKAWNERGRFTLQPQSKQRKADGRVWTHPVVLDGRLYLRDQELIYCFDVKR